MPEPKPRAAPAPTRVDALVVGAGPAGLAAALALASAGLRTLCAGHGTETTHTDTRTTALLRPSVRFLENLGVWRRCAAKAAPLEGIRIIDDTGGLLRAPEVAFHCRELGGEAFGRNVANTDLLASLLQTARETPGLEIVETTGAAVARIGGDAVTVETAEGRVIEAGLVAAADGRRSACREAAGIATRSWRYDQAAIACSFEHAAPHENWSYEFHRPAGPLTSVPLPGRASSLVWVERPGEADRLMGLDDTAFAGELERRLHGVLGAIGKVGPRSAFPLSGLTPAVFARSRIALVGEAAHVLPPIGAQGLNLGFRDAAALAEHAGRAFARRGDPGADAALRAYDRTRRGDVLARTAAVDLLNRSLLTPLLPLQTLRGVGLHLLNGVPPLKRFVMRRGVAPLGELPPLMR